ncbi:MAG: hypothetical protein ACC653_05940 [Gammaproteobacteria bacterium]
MTNQPVCSEKNITLYSHISAIEIRDLLKHFGLNVNNTQSQAIPGSYWGDSEAGLIKNNLYVRDDTPIHSLLHEACHYICMDQTRREDLDTDAGGDYDEENAVCYLQILLSDRLNNFSRNTMFKDMDNWGYTFRLGSAKRWFENDAQDAKNWLISKKIITDNEQINLKI